MLRLQLGVAQVAVTMVVPAVLAVTSDELVLVLVPRVTGATPAGTELQARLGRIETPLESMTSATRFWVFVGARLNVVLVLAASCTRIETTGQTKAAWGTLFSPATLA